MTTQPSTSPLAREVSVFSGSTNTTPVENVPLEVVLERIQDGTYQQYIEWLRNMLDSEDSEGYRRAKEQSIAFTPCCALYTRAKETPWTEKLISTTGLVHFDLDHLDDPEVLKCQLAQDSHVAFAFVSPSAHGLKIGVAAGGITGPEDYKHAWAVVLDALKRTYPDVHFNEDPHVRFLNALCYVSYDPRIYVNGHAVPFVVPAPAPKPVPKPRLTDATPDYTHVASALAYIPNNDADYETWLMLGMALHSTGESWARDLWDGWSRQSGKFDDRKQDKSWGSFTSDGSTTIASLFHLAKQHGYVPPQQATLHVGARNGYGMRASGAAQQNGQNGHEQGATPQMAQPALDVVEVARQAADALLQELAKLADDKKTDDEKEEAILEAIPALAPLDTISWMRLKRQLKAAVPTLNLNDLAQVRSEIRRASAHQVTAPAGGAQAQIAAALAQEYAGQLVYETSRKTWMAYANGLWTPIDTEYIQQRIASYMDALLHGDYTWYELSGVEHLLGRRLAQTLTLETPGWLPFRNGALRLETMTLHAHSPDRPFPWQLPHHYDPQTTCPKTQAWLHETVGGAHDQVQVLRAYAKAVVTRRVDLQRYLETIGPGGTGKGTYTRLLQALVGSENTFATELKHLEANRFELSNLRGKVLLMITDAERYSGPINALKAITGQDFVRMEEKFKAQRTEIAPVMVVVAANEPVQSADYTSGLERRRLSMYFCHRPTNPRDLLSWKDSAWHGELAPEIPGVLNWVLALPDVQMEALLQQTKALVPSLQATWAQALVDTNPLAEWANQALILDGRIDAQGRPEAMVNVGRAHKIDFSNDYEHQDVWLYPNYRAWVDDTGGKPLSSRRFTGLLKDLFDHQLRLEGVEHRDDNKGSRFCGIRFRAPSDADKPLLITKHPPLVTDVTCTVTDETRASDGCDACDAFVQSLYGHLPTPCTPLSPLGGVGVSIEDLCNNPSNTSHPSLVRERSVTDLSPYVTEPLSERRPAVGEWVWLLSADGVQQNVTPYLVRTIVRGPDGELYALFLDQAGGWPLARCERVAPLATSLLDENEASWSAEVAEPFTPNEAFDVLYEERRDAQEETDMRTVLTTLAKAQACPQCRCTNLKALGEYRTCPLCHWKGKVVQPGESEVSA